MIIYDAYYSDPDPDYYKEYIADCSISDVYAALTNFLGFHRVNKNKIRTLIAWLPNIARINAGTNVDREDIEVIFSNGERVEMNNIGIARDLCDMFIDY